MARHDRKAALDGRGAGRRGFTSRSPGTKPWGECLQSGMPVARAHETEQGILVTAHRLLPSGRTAAILLAVAVAVLPGGVASAPPAAAQSAGSAIDHPTAGTLPPGTSTVKDNGVRPRDQSSGQVAPPSAIQSSTDVMQSGGTIQGKGDGGGTNLVKHLPKDMR